MRLFHDSLIVSVNHSVSLSLEDSKVYILLFNPITFMGVEQNFFLNNLRYESSIMGWVYIAS